MTLDNIFFHEHQRFREKKIDLQVKEWFIALKAARVYITTFQLSSDVMFKQPVDNTTTRRTITYKEKELIVPLYKASNN